MISSTHIDARLLFLALLNAQEDDYWYAAAPHVINAFKALDDESCAVTIELRAMDAELMAERN